MLPLSLAEVEELYATNAATFPDDERMVTSPLPAVSTIPSPEEFSLALKSQAASIDKGLWINLEILAGKEPQIDELIHVLANLVAEFKRFADWQLAAIDAGRDNLGKCRAWEELILVIEEVRDLAAKAHADFVRFQPVITNGPPLDVQLNVAGEIFARLLGGGGLKEWSFFSLGWSMPTSWQDSYDAWQTNGHAPETIEEVNAFRRLLEIMLKRGQLRNLWNGLMTANGELTPIHSLAEPENTAIQFTQMIKELLGCWNSRCSTLIDQLRHWIQLGRFLGRSARENGDSWRITPLRRRH